MSVVEHHKSDGDPRMRANIMKNQLRTLLLFVPVCALFACPAAAQRRAAPPPTDIDRERTAMLNRERVDQLLASLRAGEQLPSATVAAAILDPTIEPSVRGQFARALATRGDREQAARTASLLAEIGEAVLADQQAGRRGPEFEQIVTSFGPAIMQTLDGIVDSGRLDLPPATVRRLLWIAGMSDWVAIERAPGIIEYVAERPADAWSSDLAASMLESNRIVTQWAALEAGTLLNPVDRQRVTQAAALRFQDGNPAGMTPFVLALAATESPDAIETLRQFRMAADQAHGQAASQDQAVQLARLEELLEEAVAFGSRSSAPLDLLAYGVEDSQSRRYQLRPWAVKRALAKGCPPATVRQSLLALRDRVRNEQRNQLSASGLRGAQLDEAVELQASARLSHFERVAHRAGVVQEGALARVAPNDHDHDHE